MAPKPLIINFFGGPGAGKTTNALELTAKLKRMKANAAYVPEYARELVLEDRLYEVDQRDIYEEQEARMRREMRGGVEVIVTDAPLIMQAVYAPDKEMRAEVINRAKRFHKGADVINIFLKNPRDIHLSVGRAHDKEQSINLDEKIKGLLESCDIHHLSAPHTKGAAWAYHLVMEWCMEEGTL